MAGEENTLTTFEEFFNYSLMEVAISRVMMNSCT